MRIIGFGAVVTAAAAALLWNHSDQAGSATGAAKPVAGATKPAAAAPVPRPATIPPTVIGMNLGSPAFYSTEWAFANLLKGNGDFTMGGITPPPVPLAADGRPTRVPKDSHFMVTVDPGGFWRTGNYNCTFPPGWRVNVRFPYKGTGGTLDHDRDHGRLTIPTGTPGTPIQLEFNAEVDGATMKPLSCVAPGLEGKTFNPKFLADMKPFRVIRFMDWMSTNNHAPAKWSERALPTDLSLVPRGASVEDMVELANTLGSDPWFTLPFDADEDYYRNFAIYVRDHLAPDRKAYVELSNEVWNGAFKQARDAAERGKARYPGKDEQKAVDYYYADRVRDLMAIWTQVFAGHTDRLVRVASSQAVWTQRAGDILGHKDTWRSVDAIATAPYFGTVIQDISEQGKVRIDKVLARLPAQADKAVKDAAEVKATADHYGISFITYEGGPDVIGFTPDAGQDAMAISRDPRMYQIYTDFLEKWRTKVGGLLVLYQGTNASTFGHREFTGQPVSETPKMRALLDFMARHPQ